MFSLVNCFGFANKRWEGETEAASGFTSNISSRRQIKNRVGALPSGRLPPGFGRAGNVIIHHC
ncbi:hypothetical protein IscW_ISCW004188 [Ixodes scapularis]|uniref:Uncharacterized protein n=1 Tax=Ixodes scapularis TaxID=6945 RepID=B7PF96_IXOSC|nr:hypothetical protein IscW_ISCW004188 [Ixodes scapularis]|eukprot:XP_002433868.1 hypothetical protein IscW_ISCW004188 [Ixodes scapularis]